MASDHQHLGEFVARRSDRRAVGSRAQLRSATWYDVEVEDLSPCGFKAACDQPVGIGSVIALDVPGIGAVEAQVRWQIGGKLGGMFLDPISLAQCAWTAVAAEPPVSD